MESLPTGWVRIGALTFWQRLIVSGWSLTPVLLTVIIICPQFVIGPGFRGGGIWGLAFGLLGLVILTFGLVLIHTVRHPAAAVNFDGNELKAGSKTVPLADIDAAILRVSGSGRAPSLLLQIGSGKKMFASVFLRDRSTMLLGDTDRELLAEVLRRTNVVMPYSPNDPKGRFAKYNFPGHLDRDGAIDLVLHTPQVGEPLPVSL